jgi:CRP-like cAMP-binding protein
MPTTKREPPVNNRLLAKLPKKEYQRLLPQLESVTLAFGKILYEPGASIHHVYFPDDSVISLLAEVADRSSLEVGIIGNEGMVGISIFMGVRTARNRAVVQGAGTAMRMKAAALRHETTSVGSLHRLLHRYSHSLLTQVAQSAACNRFHQVNARLARWLLMTHDRLGTDEFQLTQEFMSNMLGVRREGVTAAARLLQRERLISYSRGRIKILNRAGLAAATCKCYRIIRDESDSYLLKN